jgi:hypothetical protein
MIQIYPTKVPKRTTYPTPPHCVHDICDHSADSREEREKGDNRRVAKVNIHFISVTRL